jgi:hypothetical protein
MSALEATMSARPERGEPRHAQGGAKGMSAPTEGGTSRSAAQETARQSSETRAERDFGMTGNTAHRPEEFNPDDFE